MLGVNHMKQKPMIRWLIVSVYTFSRDKVSWGNYKTREEARHSCKSDKAAGVRKSKVVKFMEVL